MALKEKINYLKQINDCTSQDIIDATKIPKGTLNKILSGETTDPRIGTVIAISKYFNVTVDYLVEDEIPLSKVEYKELQKNNQIDIDSLPEEKQQALKGYLDRLLEEN